MSVSIKVLAEMLRHLDEETLEELFDMVMVEYDSSPLSEEEKKLIPEAEEAYKKGDVVVKSIEEI